MSLDTNASGRIYGSFGNVGLNDILQLLGMSRRTATVFIKYQAKEGTILFKEGMVQHAAAGGTTGEDALVRLVRWTNADFVIDEGIPDAAPETIGKSVDAIMLDVMTKLDEGRIDGDAIFTPATPLDKMDLKALETKVRSSRLRPPRPRRRRSRAAFPIAVATVVLVLAVSGSLVAWRQLAFDAGSVPSFSKRTDARPTVFESGRSVANDVLAGALSPGMVDALDVLDRHGVSLDAVEPSSSAVAAPIPESVPSIVRHGGLLVLAEPWGEVRIDGELVGQTPLPAIELLAGEHDVELSNPSFIGAIRARVRVSEGETTTTRVSFFERGTLRVLVTPWADVYIDGRHVGQTPFDALSVSVGEHRVHLKHPSLGEQEKSVVIRRGESTVLEVIM